jgi:putative methyltransferase (TIGR04325 family)
MSSLRALIDLPPLRALRKARFDRRFATPAGGGACRGAFATFADATNSAPRTAALGYDSAPAAAMYRDRLDQLFAADYPALYWLSRISVPASTLIDFGGHVGVSYHAFRSYLAHSMPSRWTVCDVPAVASAGADLARERGASDLHFVSSLADAGAADVFFAAGSLQYLEPDCATLLRQLPALPQHVLINKTPTHPTRSFVTVQHIGVGYCPYRITAHHGFAEQLRPLGYQLRDSWTNPDLRCIVPFEPDAGPITYRGYYFERAV